MDFDRFDATNKSFFLLFLGGWREFFYGQDVLVTRKARQGPP